MKTLRDYQVDLYWKEDQKGKISSVLFNDAIEVASDCCLKDFKHDAWSAEHLLVASLETSYMIAFFKTAKNKGIKYNSFKSSAKGSIIMTDEYSEITDIIIKPTVTILESNQINKTLKIFSLCREHCLVLNALKIRTHIFPSVIVEKQ